MKQRYNLARALLNAKTQGTPEYEDHFRLVREDAPILNKVGIEPNRPWKSLVRAPYRSLLTRDLNVNASSNAALTVSTVIPEIQQALRPSSLIFRLPIQIVEANGVFVLPRLSSGTSANHLSEIQVLSSSDPSVGATGSGPSRLSVQVSFSKQLLVQAAGSESLDDVLKRDLSRAISQKLDNEAINGNNAGDSTGIANLTNVLSTFTFGGAATFASYMGAQKTIETNFVDASSALWLIGPNSAFKARQALRGTSTAKFILEDDCIGSIGAYVSTFVSSEQAFLADWSQVVIGIWGGGFDFVVDPYTKANSGEIVITCSLYWNIYVRRPQAVVLSTDSGAQ